MFSSVPTRPLSRSEWNLRHAINVNPSTERQTMVEITLNGLNARQKVLADIMWSMEEWRDVEKFIRSLPKRERAEAEGIIEMMRMETVEAYRREMGLTNTPEADRVIGQFRLTK